MGNVLTQLIQNTQYTASRIGGDEFVVLLPNAGEASLQSSLRSLHELMIIDNQYHSIHPISLSVGHASSRPNERIEDTLRRADKHMYMQKKQYYARLNPQ